MINRVILVGRITKDPELKYTSSDTAVCSFTLAVNRTFTNQEGEREADFINCVCWRKTAENLSKFIRKGGMIGVEGRVQTRSYETEAAEKRYVTEIVCDNVRFLESKGESKSNENIKNPSDFSEDKKGYVNEDDLPF